MKTLACDICSKPTSIKTAYLSVMGEEVDAYIEARAFVWVDGVLQMRSGSDLAKLPDEVKWYWAHTDCIPDERELYAIPALRINTSAKALGWTLHLMGKNWFKATDWAAAIRKLGLSEDGA
jgi:hypothetical protein